MAVKIRLRRCGSNKRPSYRIIVTDGRFKRDGRFIETIGHYSPLDKKVPSIDEERFLYWVSRGAKPTEGAKRLLKVARKTKSFNEK